MVGGRRTAGKEVAELGVGFVFGCCRPRRMVWISWVATVVFTEGEKISGAVPIVGWALMSSRSALRPWLAAAKDFSHSFNSCRRLFACSWFCGIVFSSVLDIVVIAFLTVENLNGLNGEDIEGRRASPSHDFTRLETLIETVAISGNACKFTGKLTYIIFVVP